MTRTTPERRDVILFDGTCGVCDRFVQFVLDRDRERRFAFAPLQGAFARVALGAATGEAVPVRSLHVVRASDGAVLSRTRAVLHVLGALRWRPWLVRAAALVPRGAADALYDLFAANRHRFLPPACRLLAPAERTRFLP